MYLEKIVDKNIGPIDSLEIDCEFNEKGNPKPIILVGENGTGKSTFLSNIVDAFYECAGTAYSNAREPVGNSGEQQYYKTISSTEIKIGEKYLLSYLKFKDSNAPSKNLEYIYKSGNLSVQEYHTITKSDTSKKLNWENNDNYKNFDINKNDSEKIFSNNVLCYFGPDRYEKPFWLGNKYYKLSDFEHPNIQQPFSGILYNDISINNMTIKNLNWILDIIIDSRTEIKKNEDNGYSTVKNISEINTLSTARKNVEKIMSEILCQEISFGLNYRNSKGTRFNIRLVEDNSIMMPTIDSLSTGQSALFHMFSTIIHYADNIDIYNSIYLDKITGIVIIDEIELHLHSNLQYEILPKLIKLFPKIQFIITTHSPLFLLGMKNEFSENEFSIYNMPNGTQISTERFSEFHKSYKYLMNTQKHENEINEIIAQNNSKMLIVTEGSTDWKHMKAAYEDLKTKEEYKEIFEGLDINFLEFEPKNSSENSEIKLEMGNSNLCNICIGHSSIRQPNKMIFIADCDDKNTTKQMSEIGCKYKSWGNNVYSFTLPVPDNRKDTPLICIEHLYDDATIQKPVIQDKNEYRLFLGNEFNEYRTSLDGKYIIKCNNPKKIGKTSIAIIDRSNGTEVVEIKDTCSGKNIINHLISKMDFANKILKHELPFENINFENFLEIFRIIKEISNQPLK
ncbi:MAG: AAA family ATPase [Sphaerochaetaceae bacterium]|nr:AAA family ATPase [Sphaerochaetaceae bacterium]